jgi:hypothetical protein
LPLLPPLKQALETLLLITLFSCCKYSMQVMYAFPDPELPYSILEPWLTFPNSLLYGSTLSFCSSLSM